MTSLKKGFRYPIVHTLSEMIYKFNAPTQYDSSPINRHVYWWLLSNNKPAEWRGSYSQRWPPQAHASSVGRRPLQPCAAPPRLRRRRRWLGGQPATPPTHGTTTPCYPSKIVAAMPTMYERIKYILTHHAYTESRWKFLWIIK
jgi:hypothetical protein